MEIEYILASSYQVIIINTLDLGLSYRRNYELVNTGTKKVEVLRHQLEAGCLMLRL